jgi:DNA-binding SARP family transcriptional activator
MTTLRAVKPEWSGETQACCGTVIQHLNNRDYSRAASVLRKAQTICGKSGDPVAARVLNAAHRLCLACAQSREEAEWHGKLYAEVLEREQELRQELESILGSISTPEAGEPAGKPTLVSGGQNPSSSGSGGPHGLWNRIQSLIHAAGHSYREHPPEERSPLTTVDAPRETDEHTDAPDIDSTNDAPHSLAVCCLGHFQVYRDDRLVAAWRNGKAKSVFKYLIVHHDRPVSKEILMDLFWPDANPDHARNSLNVTIYHIRQTLSVTPPVSHLLFQDNCYLLNPELAIWVDSETFAEHIALARAMEQHGNREATIREYCAADALYGGEFLEEDRYEEWIMPIRQALEDDYLKLLDRLSHHYFETEDFARCLMTCNKLLGVDACQEEAHRRIMRCHWRQNQRNLALRQYHHCVKALKRDLGVAPSPLTVELNRRIQNRVDA